MARSKTPTFEYGICRLRDLQVPPADEADDKPTAAKPSTAKPSTAAKPTTSLTLGDRVVTPARRFWNSLQMRFGFTHNIFRYFTHEEVFRRISRKAPDDRVRYCLETRDDGTPPTLLAVSSPTAGCVRYDDLAPLLRQFRATGHEYHDGVVRSWHAPRHGGPFTISGDGFESQYVIETPIDAFGRPSVYLALVRLVCSNGAVARTPAFRGEINIGRSGAKATFGLERALEGFNNEEGFAALRQRFESATKSWASVHEVSRLGRTITGMLEHSELPSRIGGGETVARAFDRMAGDLTRVYGLANLDALSAKRQRTLPSACRVYDVLNFASELATHHATPVGGRRLQGLIGDLVSGEFDLEGTADRFADWKDFFLEGSAETAKGRKKGAQPVAS